VLNIVRGGGRKLLPIIKKRLKGGREISKLVLGGKVARSIDWRWGEEEREEVFLVHL